jgi:hypothetical protein
MHDDEKVRTVVIDLGRIDDRVVAVVDRQRVEREDVAQDRLACVTSIRVNVDPQQSVRFGEAARIASGVRPVRRAPAGS